MIARSYSKTKFSFVLAKLPSKVAVSFAFPPAMNEISCCFASLPATDTVKFYDFSYSKRCVVVSHCCFDLHFPNDHIWMQCIFSYVHLPMCIFFWGRYLFSSLALFLFGLFSYCWILSAPCIIFSYFVVRLLIFLTASFTE